MATLGSSMRWLVDQNQRFTRSGVPVYLRMRNFANPQAQTYVKLGFVIAPSGNVATGMNDVLITPQPGIVPVSQHDIGQSMGKLRFGAKQFFISATFANKQAVAQQLADPYQVWSNPSVVGLYSDLFLYSIESITHRDIGGQTVLWRLVCNANDLRTDSVQGQG